MIGGASIEVTCDGPGCKSATYVDLPEITGGYLRDEQAIQQAIQRMGWVVTDEGHYCCRECAD